MDRAALKQHLRLAREEAIPVAFSRRGRQGDPAAAPPQARARALETELKKEHPESRNHRWGTAQVDAEDPKLVRFTVNKAGGGFGRKLVAALKGTGYNKVRIGLEDGTEVEAHEEGDGTAGADGADAQHAAGQPAEEHAGLAPTGHDDPAAPAPGPVLPGQPDARQLAQAPTGLVEEMLGAIRHDPSQQLALTKLATDAQSSLKEGDLQRAAAGVEALRAGLAGLTGNATATGATGAAADGSAASAPPGDAVAPAPAGEKLSHLASPRIAKAREPWLATRKRVESEIGGLHGAFSSALQGHDMADELGKLFHARVGTVLDTLDEALAHKLEAVNGTSDAAERAKHVQQEARGGESEQDRRRGEGRPRAEGCQEGLGRPDGGPEGRRAEEGARAALQSDRPADAGGDRGPQPPKDGRILNGLFDGQGKLHLNLDPHSSVSTGMDTAIDTMIHENCHQFQRALVKKLESGQLKPGDPDYEQATIFAANSGSNHIQPEKDPSSLDPYVKQPEENHSRAIGAATARAIVKKL